MPITDAKAVKSVVKKFREKYAAKDEVWPIIAGNAMACSWASQSVRRRLLQLPVLRFCVFQDGNVGVGVLPQGEKSSDGLLLR